MITTLSTLFGLFLMAGAFFFGIRMRQSVMDSKYIYTGPGQARYVRLYYAIISRFSTVEERINMAYDYTDFQLLTLKYLYSNCDNAEYKSVLEKTIGNIQRRLSILDDQKHKMNSLTSIGELNTSFNQTNMFKALEQLDLDKMIEKQYRQLERANMRALQSSDDLQKRNI